MNFEEPTPPGDIHFSNLIELYNSAVDVFKFYWGLALKLNFFLYAGSGIVFSFWIQHPDQESLLYLPLILSLLFTILTYCGLILAHSYDSWFSGYMKRILEPFWDYEYKYDRYLESKGHQKYFGNDVDITTFYWPGGIPFQIFLGLSTIGSLLIFSYLAFIIFGLCIMAILILTILVILGASTPFLCKALLSLRSEPPPSV